MILTIFASIGGFRIGDMLFALLSFFGFLTLLAIIIIFALKRSSGKRDQLQRMEEKLDQLLDEKRR
ncbi:hypothetical protein SAMN04487944_11213 [Gracilibacillus ureilyticus]|uniref:DUF4083 domain-containing protein n=1 Tax=Gracilibacillus ureilyticus TaxID=531814 RepID=A0A1H9SV55_9BACI|nr:hypothetical protein [Gracilibacillus ureilyticus]SER88714.1 hypothetical protein SAMN04487944_11213 [Gracilibacillus ureilyticus]